MFNRCVYILLFIIVVVPFSAIAKRDSHDVEELYKGAFKKGLKLEERLQRIKEVARDYPDSRWGDDALWVLGEIYENQGKLSSAIILWQQMRTKKGGVELESFTRNRKLFDQSRASQLEFVIERTGHIYERGDEGTTRYDVLPLSIHDQLGRAYEKLDMADSAVREYERALNLVRGDYLTQYYKKRLNNLKKKSTREEGKTQKEDPGEINISSSEGLSGEKEETGPSEGSSSDK